MSKQLNYIFKIYPFAWDGSNGNTKYYKTDGSVPVLTVSTVPTIGEWGMIIFIISMAFLGFVYLRKIG